jgi:hypothetical protein
MKNDEQKKKKARKSLPRTKQIKNTEEATKIAGGISGGEAVASNLTPQMLAHIKRF